MALKDRLEARRQGGDASQADGALTVIEGTRPVSPVSTPQFGAYDESAQKSARTPTVFATAKAAIHAMLVERHAHEIDISDREGVRSRIASLAEEYSKNVGITLSR